MRHNLEQNAPQLLKADITDGSFFMPVMQGLFHELHLRRMAENDNPFRVMPDDMEKAFRDYASLYSDEECEAISQEFQNFIKENPGILYESAENKYAFQHLIFLEIMACKNLLQNLQAPRSNHQEIITEVFSYPEWSLPFQLMMEELTISANYGWIQYIQETVAERSDSATPEPSPE